MLAPNAPPVLPPVVRPAAPPPVMENGSEPLMVPDGGSELSPLKRKASELQSSATTAIPNPSAQQPPVIPASNTVNTSASSCSAANIAAVPDVALVTPRAASSLAFGTTPAMAIALDSSSSDEDKIPAATPPPPPASLSSALCPQQEKQHTRPPPTEATTTPNFTTAALGCNECTDATVPTPGDASAVADTTAPASLPPTCAGPSCLPLVLELPQPVVSATSPQNSAPTCATPAVAVAQDSVGVSDGAPSTLVTATPPPVPSVSAASSTAVAPPQAASPAATPSPPSDCVQSQFTSHNGSVSSISQNGTLSAAPSSGVDVNVGQTTAMAPAATGSRPYTTAAASAAAGVTAAATAATAATAAFPRNTDGNNNGSGFHDPNGTEPPKSKRRGRGRPLGSKKKVSEEDGSVEDAPYVQPVIAPRRRVSNFVPNIASRPKRQPGVTRRWADEMANPGEQWQRKVSLPSNPVDAHIPEAPTFYPSAKEFRDPLSYIESIRLAAEDYGIAKIVPPPGWNPPETLLADHINKLLPTKKQALHSLMKSDEVYDDGEDFTVKEYKDMADDFALKWIKRERPRELLRRQPPKPKAECPPGYALDPIPFATDVKSEGVYSPVAAKLEPSPRTAAQQQQQQQQQQQGVSMSSTSNGASSCAAAPATVAAPPPSLGGLQQQQQQRKQEVSGFGTIPVPNASSSASATAAGVATLQSPSFPATQCTPAAAKALAATAAAAAAGSGGSSGGEWPGAEETISTLPTANPEVNVFTPERLRELERSYWNVVDGSVEESEVEYANDLDISEFWSGFPLPPENFMDGSSFDRTRPCNFEDPDYYRTCGWNLNNLPFWPGSVLRFFRTHVNGLTAPWLYLGMQFATFAWHNEDNYLYSLNYHHAGAPKQWYGVPGKHAQGFESCLARILGETLETVSEHLYRITKMLSPVYLQREKVPVCRLQQEAGQFVVTFPKAYHGGFSYGFNCGEAVNFAVPDWIAYSRESTEAYRQASRKAALSHDKMVATLTMYLPDHDVKGCELVVRELKRLQHEELNGRRSLELQGAQDPSKSGLQLPRFKLGLIDQDTEEYDERRMCKTCKHTLFMTGVACRCNDLDVSCIRCVKSACECPMSEKYLLSWWTETDLSRFVSTAEAYLVKLRAGQADEAAVKSFNGNIDPF